MIQAEFSLQLQLHASFRIFFKFASKVVYECIVRYVQFSIILKINLSNNIFIKRIFRLKVVKINLKKFTLANNATL